MAKKVSGGKVKGRSVKTEKGSTTVLITNGADITKLLTNDGKTKKLTKDQFITPKQEQTDTALDKSLGKRKQIDFDED
jgi:hypothetical protein